MGIVVAGCLGILALIVALSALLGFLFMVVWNVAAGIFDLPTLDFWQAWAIWILIGLIGSAFRTVVSK